MVAAAVTNASCAFVAPQLPSTPASSYQLVTLSIIPVSAYAYLLALPDRTDADVANATISACDASQCNAALGAWLRVDELDPAEQYLIMQQPGSVKAGAANAQGLVGREVEVLVQALTAGVLPGFCKASMSLLLRCHLLLITGCFCEMLVTAGTLKI